jgi:hypothetical protein
VNRQVAAAIGGMLGLAALAAWAIAGPDKEVGPRPLADRPTLALLTSLPLIFGESFGLDGGGSPALSRLEERYEVLPIGVADSASLKGHKLLLMAHPRAQPAEVLVELDKWVRKGGHVLLLADPKLDWPSELPLGDKLRPPPAFADTGLLMHWGLTLESPRMDSEATAGRLAGKGACHIMEDGLVAHCAVGNGKATVIADADFLNLADKDDGSIDLLFNELARLESR